MPENEKFKQAQAKLREAFLDMMKSLNQSSNEKEEEKIAGMKEDLIDQLVALSKKAAGNRAFVLLMETTEKEGCVSIISGSQHVIIAMLTETAKLHKPFEEAITKTTIAMSLDRIDDLMKNRNPFARTAEA